MSSLQIYNTSRKLNNQETGHLCGGLYLRRTVYGMHKAKSGIGPYVRPCSSDKVYNL